jgi:thiamine biosynthesis protein ThiC
MDIARAVALMSFAEESRRQITKYGAQSVSDLTALVKLEECAERAVRRLKLPITTINTRLDLAA